MDAGTFLAGALIGCLLFASGLAKVRDVQRFRADLAGYELFSESATRNLAVAVPPAEILTGLAVLTLPNPDVGLLAAILLLAAFTVVMTLNLLRGRRNFCGCSARRERISKLTVVKNLVWIGLAAVPLMLGSVAVLPALLGLSDANSPMDALAMILVLLLGTATYQILLMWPQVKRDAHIISDILGEPL